MSSGTGRCKPATVAREFELVSKIDFVAPQKAQLPAAEGRHVHIALFDNDSFEHFQINISSTDDRDHSLSFELLFSFEEPPNGQSS